MDIIDKIIESEKFQRDLGVRPRPVAKRERRINWAEVWALILICGISFCGGMIFLARLTDGGAW